jgi:ribosome biogenesis GTPase
MSTKRKRVRDYSKAMRKHTHRQQLRKVIKNSKHKATNKPRRKDWVPGTLDDWDDLEPMEDEPILPRGERERRREVERLVKSIPQVPAGNQAETPEFKPAGKAGSYTGQVVEVGGGLVQVWMDGKPLLCSLRGSLKANATQYTNVVAVGDQVMVSMNGDTRGVVEEVLPRRSVLARAYSPDAGKTTHLQQVVAANVDQVLIVASWREPHIWPELIDRYLIAANRNQLESILCVNKIDLIEDSEEFEDTLQPFHDLGMNILYTSALTGIGVEELGEQLAGRTTVLAGLSGAGKSTLLTALQPSLNLRARSVGERGLNRTQGRHTTTTATLLRLDNGGNVVDTPGIREFSVAGLWKEELSDYYPEIAALAMNCRYQDCRHVDENDCAVKRGVESGEVHHNRYHSYRLIYDSLPG